MSATAPSAPGGLKATFARVGPAIVFVQALSFLSSILLAVLLGPSSGTDAYYLALSVPAVVYAVLLAAIRLGGVPALTGYAQTRNGPRFVQACNELVSGTLAAAAGFSVVVIGVMIVVLPQVAGASPTVTSLTREYMAELWPYAVSGALLGVLGALLAVRGRFAISALVLGVEPLLKALLLLLFAKQLGAQALVIGNVAGNLVAVAILWDTLRRDGLRVTLVPFRTSPLVRNVLKVSAPLLISQSVLQLNPVIDRTTAASLGTGTVTVFQLGLRIFTATATVVSATVAAPLVATWSSRLARDGWDAVVASFGRVTAAVLAVLPPLVIASVILRLQLVSFAYSSHAYSASDITKTANVFAMLSLGLVPQILIAPLAALFIIRQQTVFPMIIGIANFVLNAVLDVALRGPLGVAGIALSTTLTLTLLCGLYAREANRRWGLGAVSRHLRLPVAAAAASSAATAVSGVFLLHVIAPTSTRTEELAAILPIGLMAVIFDWAALALTGVSLGSADASVRAQSRIYWGKLRSAMPPAVGEHLSLARRR